MPYFDRIELSLTNCVENMQGLQRRISDARDIVNEMFIEHRRILEINSRYRTVLEEMVKYGALSTTFAHDVRVKAIEALKYADSTLHKPPDHVRDTVWTEAEGVKP